MGSGRRLFICGRERGEGRTASFLGLKRPDGMWPWSFFSRRKRARCSWGSASLRKETFSVVWRWPFSTWIGPGRPLRSLWPPCESFPVWRGFSREGPTSWSLASSTPGNRSVPCASGRGAPHRLSRLSAGGWIRRKSGATEAPFLCPWPWRRPSPLPGLTGWDFPFRLRRPRAIASILPRRKRSSRDGPLSRGDVPGNGSSGSQKPTGTLVSRRLLLSGTDLTLRSPEIGRDLGSPLPYNDSNGLNLEQWGVGPWQRRRA